MDISTYSLRIRISFFHLSYFTLTAGLPKGCNGIGVAFQGPEGMTRRSSSSPPANIPTFLAFVFINVFPFVHSTPPQYCRELFMVKYWHRCRMGFILFNFFVSTKQLPPSWLVSLGCLHLQRQSVTTLHSSGLYQQFTLGYKM